MTTLPLVRALLLIAALSLTTTANAQPVPTCAMPDPPPEATAITMGRLDTAQRWIPTTGSIRALVVFVRAARDYERTCIRLSTYFAQPQPSWDQIGVEHDAYCGQGIPGFQSNTEDPATEWPLLGPTGPGVMPQWAAQFIDAPGTHPSNYRRGSLTHFFWEMSRGQLRYEGLVYPHLSK